VQRTTAGGVTVNDMRFNPRDIKDDGASTTDATVRYSARVGGPASLNWTIEGDAKGATIDANGKITSGTDTVPITDDKVVLTVKAVDSKQAGAHTTGRLTMWGTKFLQAKADFPKFIAHSYSQRNYLIGDHGKFDATYSPRNRRLTAEVRLAFNFVDDLPAAAPWNRATKATFVRTFISQVQRVWSGQWQFRNQKEPQLIWSKLNPITVSVVAREDAAAPHFTATVHKKDFGQQVARPTADLKASAQVVKREYPGVGPAELAALQAKIPTPILFAAGSNAVPVGDQPKLDFLGTYLHSIRRPKFSLTITGHTATGGAAPAARALSQQRARAVLAVIRARSPGVHTLSVQAKGDTAGVAPPAGDKVEITADIDPHFVNEFPRLAHEFGHMLGLGDEYIGGARAAGDPATHYNLAKDALGQQMADSFAKVSAEGGSPMGHGADVRPVHYVTLWAVLGDAAATAADPTPAFTRNDWKFVGF
jgi:outer membrane protein OmpA-like peptidoglycan-associated protein